MNVLHVRGFIITSNYFVIRCRFLLTFDVQHCHVNVMLTDLCEKISYTWKTKTNIHHLYVLT